jgi:hypothetical protein
MRLPGILLPTIALPLLLLALSGDWVWQGDGRIIMNPQDAFSGSVVFAGFMLKNSIATFSLLIAFVLVVIGIFRTNRELGILALGALVIPSLHSAGYLYHFYTTQYRNGLSHLTFVTVIPLVYWMAFQLILTPMEEEEFQIEREAPGS